MGVSVLATPASSGALKSLVEEKQPGLISSVGTTAYCCLLILLVAMPVGLHDHQMIGCSHHMAAESPATTSMLLQTINDHDLSWAFSLDAHLEKQCLHT